MRRSGTILLDQSFSDSIELTTGNLDVASTLKAIFTGRELKYALFIRLY